MPFGYYLRPQVSPFVILFVERDGSTYLVSMLESHPQMKIVYERFAVLRQKGLGASDQLNWAARYFTPPAIGRTKAIGFKTKLVDILDLTAFTVLLKEKNVKLIHMQRRNRVKAVVSRLNARKLYEATGNWNLYDRANRVPPMSIRPLEFDQYLREREQADTTLSNYVQQLGVPTLTVAYEDLLQDRNAVLEQVFAFLGIDRFPVKSRTLKHSRDDLREVLNNFDELKSYYAGTSYESMFSEVLVPN